MPEPLNHLSLVSWVSLALRGLEFLRLFCLDLSKSFKLTLLYFKHQTSLSLNSEPLSLIWVTDHFGVCASCLFFWFLKPMNWVVCSGPSFEIKLFCYLSTLFSFLSIIAIKFMFLQYNAITLK